MSHATLICMVCLAIFGIPGNLFALHELLCTKIRHRTSTPLLTCLSVCNIMYLMVQLVQVSMVLRDTQLTCSLILYANYVCDFISSWSITIFTIERFIAVFYPIVHRSRIQGSHISSTTMAVMIFVLIIYHAYIPVIVRVIKFETLIYIDSEGNWIERPLGSFAVDDVKNENVIATTDFGQYNVSNVSLHSDKTCHFDKNQTQLFSITEIVEFVACFSIPMMIMIVLNSMIACQIIRSERTRRSMQRGREGHHSELMMTGRIAETDPLNIRPSISISSMQSQNRRPTLEEVGPKLAENEKMPMDFRHSIVTLNASLRYQSGLVRGAVVSLKERAKDLKVTFSLISLSVCYFILNIPQYVYRFLILTHEIDDHAPEVAAIGNILHMIYTAQFAVNFLLYTFDRKTLANKIRKCKTRRTQRRREKIVIPQLR